MELTIFGTQFDLGQIVITHEARNELPLDEVCLALERHMDGDWGELDSFDQEQNDAALINGDRLMSRYESQNGTVFWIITEGDRSVTTVLLPREY